MSLHRIVNQVCDKQYFTELPNFLDFCERFLAFIESGIQNRIVSHKEAHYHFLQFGRDGHSNVTRPLNARLMFTHAEFGPAKAVFLESIALLREGRQPADATRETFTRMIYTVQQSIGAALDALPVGKSNKARKLNGDLFCAFIRVLVNAVDVDCLSGVIRVPLKDEDQQTELLKITYQQDLIISRGDELKVIGSVTTSSKDRIGKIFMDKFFYSKLTGTHIPHIAIFLNDVQRKNAGKTAQFSVNSTFLPGHFKAYTLKLNPLDGIYYCDPRPNMRKDPLLARHIKTIDTLFYDDLGLFLSAKGQALREIDLAEKG